VLVAWHEDVQVQQGVQEAAGTLVPCSEVEVVQVVLDLCFVDSPWPHDLSGCSYSRFSCLDQEEVLDEGTVHEGDHRPYFLDNL